MSLSNSYIPLARKYRPATFSDLCGQDATATALTNAIRLGREPHAVIFSGVRGIGKTTTARLYAKALNCLTPVNFEPCNQCDSCHSIAIGNHEDVMEIDGASNTSVDDIRSLRETVVYVPQRSKFKVYIIDEVHMLSQNAFNALLKTLEEPPSHVVFIFATTELQKIPQTIMSRCQLYHLQRHGLSTIRERIIHILKHENISYEDKAIVAIAREGHGSMRDALTLLDHVIAVGSGQVTVEALSKIISHVSSTHFMALLEGLVTRNPQTIVNTLDELEQGGINMQDVVEKVAIMARHAFIIRDVGTESLDFRSLGFDDEETKRLTSLALSAGATDLNRIFRTMSRARTDLDGSTLDRFIVENYALEWCLDPGILANVSHEKPSIQKMIPKASTQHASSIQTQMTTNVSTPTQSAPTPAPALNAAKTLANLRESLQDKTIQPAPPPLPAPTSIPQQTPSATQVEQVAASVNAGKVFPASWRELVDTWKRFKPLQAKRLEDVHPVVYSPQRIELVIAGDSFMTTALLKTDEQKKLKEAFQELFGFQGTLICLAKSEEQKSGIQAAAPLPDTLATIQGREEAAKRDQAIIDVQNDPITVQAMSLFNAKIDSIEFRS